MTRAHALSALLADDAARPQGGGDPQITSVTLDSRTVGPGALFAGLRGEKVDGATFVPKAVAAGAAAVLVGEDASLVWPDGAPPADVPIIRSKDPRRLLAR
ncbi:MAG: Mur ligase domain-containing protein, partial [Pseudomonadota bacterium]